MSGVAGPFGGEPLLSVRDLEVQFRTDAGSTTALRGVSLDVHPGETVAVVGESGSGKSTTAAAVLGLLAANGAVTGGEILFDGQDVVRLSPAEMSRLRGAQIGLVPQDPMSNLNPVRRVGAQIVEALEDNDVARGAAAQARTVELLEEAGLPDAARRAQQYPHEFSGGMRQRALIAMGLSARPRLLVADEPTSALDVTVQRTILDGLTALTARLGVAVLLITHDLGLAAERADTVVVMYRGEVVEKGPAREILQNPQHEYTRRLIAAAPSLASRRIAIAKETGDARRRAGRGRRRRAARRDRRGRARHEGLQAARARPVQPVHGLHRRRRRELHRPARPDGRARGGVRLGQVDRRAHDARPHRADVGHDPLRRRRRRLGP